MTVRAAQLVSPQLLTNASALYYTVPANTNVIVKEGTVSNTSTTATVKLTINVVATGGSAGALNEVTPLIPIAPASIYFVSELVGKVLPAGTKIYANDDTGSVSSIEISGVVVS